MSISQCRGQKILAFAAISGCLTVALGAFAAHGLSDRLSDYLLSVFKTGVQYQAWHTLALLVCGLLLMVTSLHDEFNQKARKGVAYAAIFFMMGIFCFSGSLYALALTGVKWFGPITPLGGVFFMVGWLVLAFSVLGLARAKS